MYKITQMYYVQRDRLNIIRGRAQKAEDSEPPFTSVPFFFLTKCGRRVRTLSPCQISMALRGSKSLMSGEHNCVFKRSASVSPFRLERQSLLTCFMTLNPLSQSAVLVGMVSRASNRYRTSGHSWRSILFTAGHVFSMVPVAGPDRQYKMRCYGMHFQ